MGIGFVFKKFNTNVSEYFRGGASIQWWMLGSSIFMCQFSALTFTAAAGRAYSTGVFILALFAGNALGFMINFLGMGARLRQLRVITSLDAVKERFNRFTEQTYLFVNILRATSSSSRPSGSFPWRYSSRRSLGSTCVWSLS